MTKSYDAAFRDCVSEPDSFRPQADMNVESVRQKLLSRSRLGINKYGTTTERGDIDRLGWLLHLQEELMDACVYIEALMRSKK